MPARIKESDSGKFTEYCYVSDGTKFSALESNGTGLYYIGSFVYQALGSNTFKFESAGFSKGRFRRSTSAYFRDQYVPEYYITDHLGSRRAMIDHTGELMVLKEYYPFGKTWERPHAQVTSDPYGYNGKEEQSVGDAGLLDYGARFYDPGIGRWLTQDPLAEKYYSISPYAYVYNSPVKYVDPNGADAKITIDNSAQTITVSATIVLIPVGGPSGVGIGTNVATYYKQSILAVWDKGWIYKHEGKDYKVIFDINVRMIELGENMIFDGETNYIHVTNQNIRSSTSYTNRGLWAKGTADRNPAAHEFGHILGLADKYDPRTLKVIDGWLNNIMAGTRNSVDQLNVADMRNIVEFLHKAMAAGVPIFFNNFSNQEKGSVE